MQTYKAVIRPLSAFGTTLKGDTLFGQLCWALRNRQGEPSLNDLLVDYHRSRPFVVVSDALPSGHLPRPQLPTHCFTASAEDRKILKKRIWLPLAAFAHPVADWLAHCVPSTAIPGGSVTQHPQPHNSINRLTNTTGDGFAPYSMNQYWYAAQPDKKSVPCPSLDIILVLDESRLSPQDLRQALEDMGQVGFGRDASIGLGKFEVTDYQPSDGLIQADANAWLTLAPCAPQGLPWNETQCFYQPFTRFGRHGDVGVHLGKPFKTPVLLADTGAVLMPKSDSALTINQRFTGQGLGGNGQLSKALPTTVHQGYAPVVGIRLPR